MKKIKQAIVFMFPLAILGLLAACGASNIPDSAYQVGNPNDSVIAANSKSPASPSDETEDAKPMTPGTRYKIPVLIGAMHAADSGVEEESPRNVGDENTNTAADGDSKPTINLSNLYVNRDPNFTATLTPQVVNHAINSNVTKQIDPCMIDGCI